MNQHDKRKVGLYDENEQKKDTASYCNNLLHCVHACVALRLRLAEK
jgi:hypothetical protein